MRIAIVGSAYVGVVCGACLADFGHQVVGIDRDAEKIAALRLGVVPLFEPGLPELVAANLAADRLTFTTDLAAAVAHADVVFIAVGTPSRAGDGRADLADVYAAAREIAVAVEGFTVVAVKSTVPVGTGDEIARIIAAINPRAEVAVVANPEFLREGAAIEDFRHPQRILIGTEDKRARATMDAVYRAFRMNGVPIVFTSRRAAELTKHAANAYLAMKATFINEIADLCEAVDADIAEVAHGLGLDRRIGRQFLRPGPGFGGSCLPKDVRALVGTARDNDSPLRLVETTIAINETRKRTMADRVIAACDGTVRGKTIGLLGLTFKANTDDMREASSLAIITALQQAGAKIRAYDPAGMAAARALVQDVSFGADPYDTAAGAAALVIVTEWDAFRALDFRRLRQTVAEPVLVDLRNLLDPHEVIGHGFRYSGLGRPIGIAANMVSVAAE